MLSVSWTFRAVIETTAFYLFDLDRFHANLFLLQQYQSSQIWWARHSVLHLLARVWDLWKNKFRKHRVLTRQSIDPALCRVWSKPCWWCGALREVYVFRHQIGYSIRSKSFTKAESNHFPIFPRWADDINTTLSLVPAILLFTEYPSILDEIVVPEKGGKAQIWRYAQNSIEPLWLFAVESFSFAEGTQVFLDQKKLRIE